MTSTTKRINDLTELLNCVAQDLAEMLADEYGTANVRIRIDAGHQVIPSFHSVMKSRCNG